MGCRNHPLNTTTLHIHKHTQAGKAIVVRVPVLSGQEVRLPVKAHAVPLSGCLTLREPGHGMPKKGGGFGDLVVELVVAPAPASPSNRRGR